MEAYSSDTSYIIRQDFLRFSSEARKCEEDVAEKKASNKALETLLEESRREMTNDDGQGSLGRYKCPIF